MEGKELKKKLKECISLIEEGSVISASEKIKKMAINLDEEGLGRDIGKIKKVEWW